MSALRESRAGGSVLILEDRCGGRKWGSCGLKQQRGLSQGLKNQRDQVSEHSCSGRAQLKDALR